jgi:ABC-type transport system substrate-binding protein
MPGHSPGIGLPYDPERARQLLAEAGYPDGRGFRPLTAYLPPGGSNVFAAVASMWRDVLHVDVTWRNIAFAEFFDRIRNGSSLIWGFGEIADYPDPHSFSLAKSHLAGWRNERYLSLLEQARCTTNQATRIALYRQADRIVVEDAPILPIFHPVMHLLIRPWVRRLRSQWRGWWHEVIIDPH